MLRIKANLASSISFLLLTFVFLTLLGVYFYNILLWRHYPDLGFGVRLATGINVVGVLTDAGADAGMKLGDRIESINGHTYDSLQEGRALIDRAIGAANTYQVIRNGERLTLTIVNQPLGFGAAFAKCGFNFALGVIFFGIGFLVFVMKPHGRSAWIFFIACTVFATYITLFSTITRMTPAWMEYVTILAEVFVPAAVIHLALCFPAERQLVARFKWAQFLPYIISGIIFLGVILDSDNIAEMPVHWLIVDTVYRVAGLLLFLLSCLQLWMTSPSVIAKLRSKLILIGSAIAISVPLLDFIVNVIWQHYILPSMTYALPFYIVFPSFVGYAIVKHDLFDIDTIIKRTYGYILTTGTIAGVYGVIVLISNVIFGEFAVAQSPLFPLFFVLTVAIFFNPLRSRMQAFVDRTFYRLEYDYQETVKQISESMRSLIGLDDVKQTMMRFALEPMFIDSGCIMLRHKDRPAYEGVFKANEPQPQGENTARPVGSPLEIPDESNDPENRAATTGAEPDGRNTADTNSALVSIDESDPLIAAMTARKKEATIYDIIEDPAFEDARGTCMGLFEKLDATLMVPLIFEDKLTGILALGRKKSGKFYRPEDINLLNTLANQGAIAIENARMITEVIEKERMEEELSIAHDMQMSMLPEACPQIEGADIAAFSQPAREVGGDFYDFLVTEGGSAAVVIGDVTGKSVSGALVMSASRSIFRMLAEECLSVREMMIRANRRAKQDTQSGMFIALLYALLNTAAGTVTLCSAGQTQPILCAASDRKARLVETQGDTFPLGIIADVDYQETVVPLAPGDCLILYTDGIVEAENEQGEMLGFERLLALVESSNETRADQVLKSIIDEVNAFVGEAPQHDDLTVIVITRPFEGQSQEPSQKDADAN